MFSCWDAFLCLFWWWLWYRFYILSRFSDDANISCILMMFHLIRPLIQLVCQSRYQIWNPMVDLLNFFHGSMLYLNMVDWCITLNWFRDWVWRCDCVGVHHNIFSKSAWILLIADWMSPLQARQKSEVSSAKRNGKFRKSSDIYMHIRNSSGQNALPWAVSFQICFHSLIQASLLVLNLTDEVWCIFLWYIIH